MLQTGDDPEIPEVARALIEKIIIHPPATEHDPPGIELNGDLLSLLQTARVPDAFAATATTCDSVLSIFVSSVKVVQGQSSRSAKPIPGAYLS